MAVPSEKLDRIYAGGDDPWGFRSSAYEQSKFRATCAALPRARYRSALELGCGNGELARHVAPRCAAYTGVDAVETALHAARRAVPRGRFHRLFLPAPLPEGAYDLLLLSEILYFLDPAGLEALADQLDRRWPMADLVCVTWLGPSGNPLEGQEALGIFRTASRRAFRPARITSQYRIDLSRAPR
ncbi:class I SAM-dependent methyltransferase [Limimaricola sp. ASW11-118]|uniref:Class I SAM-dependent methyltransferase n=1 Tax=Limimaricola litoreus TaxID=2955316 RepID=A0A9X2FNK4_9RHOB|nr:class I SAM-dependent methyltransferase [Limimaricola litoreus]MCP1168251.1 class I SAM-dependent methyltransferase [Limimaricola litoreus]